MATSIATKALKPRTAVLIAGAINLVGAFLPLEVASDLERPGQRGADHPDGDLRGPGRRDPAGTW